MARNCDITLNQAVEQALLSQRQCQRRDRGDRPQVHILLIEDNAAEARLIQEVLKGTALMQFDLIHVKRLAESVAFLEKLTTDPNRPPVDIILLDLTLPDSYGLDSLDTLVQLTPSLPIVVLTNTHDDDLALEAVRRGAQDYLFKRQINQDMLVRSLRYAIERKQAAEALREANEILELRVQQRTTELKTSNELLRREIEWRQTIQERLQLAQQAGQIGSFEWNLQTHHVTWTAELEALYQVAAGSFADRTEPWLQTLHPEDRPKVEQELQQAIQAGRGVHLEFRCLCPGGEIRWIALKSSLFFDTADQPLRMIGIHMDITEKKQLEEQFLHAQRLESLGTLAGGIAHDLNNILTPILAVSQLLLLKFPHLNEQTQQMLQTLQASARRGADLVKQILSFTRGVEGKRSCLQMHHLLAEVVQIVQQTLPKSITIDTNFPSDLWPIHGDATQLHQVLMNLCVNARDAMPQGGILQITASNLWIDEATARLHLEAQSGNYICITISDTGIGIPASILHRIFDPFFTTKEIGKGTGLGLAAVLGIVKSHNGFIDVHSVVQQGSQFHIYLPACQTPEVHLPSSGELLHGHQELILVIDDEVPIAQVLQTMLEAYNYRAIIAHDAPTAIALYAQHKDNISTILMDMMMPTMSGLALAPILLRLNPAARIIAMSGLSSAEAVAQAEQSGVQHFLAKPFTTKSLLQVLQQPA